MDDNYLPEQWQRIRFDENICEKEAYLISTHGRVKSLKVDKEKGIICKVSSFAGYPRIALVQKTGKRTARYIHKLVAEAFIEKRDETQQFVIHLDFDKLNNKVSNLEWANKLEKETHFLNNPEYKNPANRVKNSKLTEGRVRMIKRKLNDPNRKTRMKMIAKQFGISEMQLYRIKTGENWGYVTVDER